MIEHKRKNEDDSRHLEIECDQYGNFRYQGHRWVPTDIWLHWSWWLYCADIFQMLMTEWLFCWSTVLKQLKSSSNISNIRRQYWCSISAVFTPQKALWNIQQIICWKIASRSMFRRIGAIWMRSMLNLNLSAPVGIVLGGQNGQLIQKMEPNILLVNVTRDLMMHVR